MAQNRCCSSHAIAATVAVAIVATIAAATIITITITITIGMIAATSIVFAQLKLCIQTRRAKIFLEADVRETEYSDAIVYIVRQQGKRANQHVCIAQYFPHFP